MLLGWNTADEQTYGRMEEYVKGGGTLFLSIPHLTTNESRRFLLSGLEPLNLLRDGDFADLLGVRARGKAERISAVRVLAVPDNPLAAGKVYSFAGEDGPSVQPRHPPVSREAVELAGAAVLACDEATGEPVVVRHRVGQGRRVHVLLTHEYPRQLLPRAADDRSHPRSRLAGRRARGAGRPERRRVLHRAAGSGPSRRAGRRRSPAIRGRARGHDRAPAEHRLDGGLGAGAGAGCGWAASGCRSPWRRAGSARCCPRPSSPLLVADPRVHVEAAAENAGRSVDLHGFGQVEIRLRRAGGQAIAKAEFRGERLDLEADGPWWVARPEFGHVERGTAHGVRGRAANMKTTQGTVHGGQSGRTGNRGHSVTPKTTNTTRGPVHGGRQCWISSDG